MPSFFHANQPSCPLFLLRSKLRRSPINAVTSTLPLILSRRRLVRRDPRLHEGGETHVVLVVPFERVIGCGRAAEFIDESVTGMLLSFCRLCLLNAFFERRVSNWVSSPSSIAADFGVCSAMT